MNLSNDYHKNCNYLNQQLGLKETFDIASREITILKRKLNIYYLSALIDSEQIILLIQTLYSIPNNKNFSFDEVLNCIAHHNVSVDEDYLQCVENVLNGVIVIIFEDEARAISVDVRKFPSRAVAEPDTEKVIRGSHEGFTESLMTNIGLIRRRIRDGALRNEIYKIGTKSPIDVCLTYIEGTCDPKTLADIKSKLSNVVIDNLIMSDKALEEIILKQKINPYPLVRYTERPDTVSVHLYQGMFAILVDTSPSVILAPATFFDHLQHLEEYRQTPLSGTYLRFLRYIGVFISLFLTPLWLLAYENDWLLNTIFVPTESQVINIFLQLIIAEMGIEFLRMASIHTPTALSTAMGLIAGILIGDIAIRVGVFSVQTVLFVALSAIGTYITPSYELGLANKIIKLVFIVIVFCFGTVGFVIALVLWIFFLAMLKSAGKPYLYPLIPFKPKELLKFFIRFPYKNKKQ